MPLLEIPQNRIRDRRERQAELKPNIATKHGQPNLLANHTHVPRLRHPKDRTGDTAS